MPRIFWDRHLISRAKSTPIESLRWEKMIFDHFELGGIFGTNVKYRREFEFSAFFAIDAIYRQTVRKNKKYHFTFFEENFQGFLVMSSKLRYLQNCANDSTLNPIFLVKKSSVTQCFSHCAQNMHVCSNE